MSSEKILLIDVPVEEVTSFIEYVKSLDNLLTVTEEEKSRSDVTLFQTIIIGIAIDVTANVVYDLIKHTITKKYKIRFSKTENSG